LLDQEYTTPTPIQEQAIPPILQGKDIMASAQTGTGKTAGFTLPLLQKLAMQPRATGNHTRALVLTPTRELAAQVHASIETYGKYLSLRSTVLFGGVKFSPQMQRLCGGVDVLVATPGRLLDLFQQNTLDLDAISTLVLDEADRMLDMGFEDSMDAIVNELPRQRPTLLFSATYPPQIQAIAERVMVKPVLVQALEKHDSSSIKQDFYSISDEGERAVAVRLLLLKYRPDSTVIFCNTKRHVKDLTQELKRHGFSVLALHGDLEQKERDQALIRFSNNSVSIMVATDVAARGLDIDSLDLVINYHIASDPEIHVHRIGRTGRAGNKGHACSIVISKEKHKVARLAEYLGQEIEPIALPDTQLLKEPTFRPPMATIQIDGGKKQKLRPGDILGALTGDAGIDGKAVGKIDVLDYAAFVAIERKLADAALKRLNNGKIKGRKFKVRRL